MIKSHKYVKNETLDNLISKYSTLVYDTESKLYGSLNAEKIYLTNLEQYVQL